MELLDAILIVTKCECAEQLKDLSPERKLKLAHSLEQRVPSGLAPIEEWNEVISCFVDAKPETDNKKAKRKLLSILRGEECKEEPAPATKNKWWQFKNTQ